jgi:hypothetical protein
VTCTIAKKTADESARYARLGLLSLGGGHGHIGFSCDGWYRRTGEEHDDYDSDELPDFVEV